MPNATDPIPQGYLARLTWNTLDWTRPSGNKHEDGYAGKNGFGHEEWLNREEWVLNGWRYGFIQGVFKSRERLLGKNLNIRLHAVRPHDMARLYVGELRGAEVLTDAESGAVYSAFEQQGWLKTMRQEVAAIGGNVQSLDKDVANIRFRPGTLQLYTRPVLAAAGDQIQRYSRYQVIQASAVALKQWAKRTTGAKPSNPDWTTDEHVLALDVYMAAKPGQVQKGSKEVRELSQLLLRLHAKLGTKASTSLRNEDGVYMKMGNFKRLDPDFSSQGKKGLSRGAKGEKDVWERYSGNRLALQEEAAAIRATILSDIVIEDATDDPLLAEEGRVLTRVHRVYERSRENREKKLAAFRKKNRGRVFCEACGFDFEKTFGPRGAGYIECHHALPVSQLRPNQRLTLSDFRLLCSNCHRMVHVRAPWLTFEELRAFFVG